jgi:hypothetical protein
MAMTQANDVTQCNILLKEFDAANRGGGHDNSIHSG